MQVAVVGNARLEDPSIIQMCRHVGETLARRGYSIVCGGLGGVMEETCRGFKGVEGSGSTVGILPSYNASSANRFIDITIPTGLDIGRNQLVVASGFAVIVIGGGAGTLSEIALASQIGKPVLLMKGSSGWADKLTTDYLDDRHNAALYHIHNMHELEKTLSGLEKHVDRAGIINSGHNNEVTGAR
ncbi:TIGR00725 family protein [Spongorhabdus nitratireducens]